MSEEKVDKEVMDKEEIDKEEIDKEEIDKEEMDKEEIDKEEMDKEVMDKEVMDKEVMDKEVIDKEVMDKEEMDKEEMDKDVADVMIENELLWVPSFGINTWNKSSLEAVKIFPHPNVHMLKNFDSALTWDEASKLLDITMSDQNYCLPAHVLHHLFQTVEHSSDDELEARNILTLLNAHVYKFPPYTTNLQKMYFDMLLLCADDPGGRNNIIWNYLKDLMHKVVDAILLDHLMIPEKDRRLSGDFTMRDLQDDWTISPDEHDDSFQTDDRRASETDEASYSDREEPTFDEKPFFNVHFEELKTICNIFELELNYFMNRAKNGVHVKLKPFPMFAHVMWPDSIRLTWGHVSHCVHELMDVIGRLTPYYDKSGADEVLPCFLRFLSITAEYVWIRGTPSYLEYSRKRGDMAGVLNMTGFVMDFLGTLRFNGVHLRAEDTKSDALIVLLNNIPCDWFKLFLARHLLSPLPLVPWVDRYARGSNPYYSLSEEEQDLRVLLTRWIYAMPGGKCREIASRYQENLQAQIYQSPDTNTNKSPLQQKSGEMEVRTPPVPCTLSYKKIMKKNFKGENALHLAVINDKPEELRQMMQVPGIDVNVADHAGWTLLHEACLRHRPECLQVLITESRGQLNYCSRGNRGITPLHDAVSNNNLEITRLLLEHGGRCLLHFKDEEGRLPIQGAKSDAVFNLLKEWENKEDSQLIGYPGYDEGLKQPQVGNGEYGYKIPYVENVSDHFDPQQYINMGLTGAVTDKVCEAYLHVISVVLRITMKEWTPTDGGYDINDITKALAHLRYHLMLMLVDGKLSEYSEFILNRMETDLRLKSLDDVD